jgi:predicted dehydrogenase
MSFTIPPLIPTQPEKEWKIGIVGAGAVANAGHLPAYASQQWNVRGVLDADQDRALYAAKRFSLSKVYASLEELLADPTIDILDIALPPINQAVVAQKAIRSGKHVLCQVPLAEELATAKRITQAARATGVTLAVNHQMRWETAIRSVRHWSESGLMGKLQEATIHVRIHSSWKHLPWLEGAQRFDLLFHSIHYLDGIRYLFGEPRNLYCETRKSSEEGIPGETRTLIVLNFESGALASIDVDHCDYSGKPSATFRFLGTEAVVQGSFGLLDDLAQCRADTIDIYPRNGAMSESLKVQERWVPDAFAGPMAELMVALEQGRDPQTNGEDNLRTLQLVHAAYSSAQQHRSVRPKEIVF